MIGGRRMVRESVRAFRARFGTRAGGLRPLNVALSAFLTERRRAAWKRSKMPGQLRAYQALNCYGVRIWANRPRQFGGMRWRAACATVQKSIERQEAREWRAVAERWAVAVGVPF